MQMTQATRRRVLGCLAATVVAAAGVTVGAETAAGAPAKGPFPKPSTTHFEDDINGEGLGTVTVVVGKSKRNIKRVTIVANCLGGGSVTKVIRNLPVDNNGFWGTETADGWDLRGRTVRPNMLGGTVRAYERICPGDNSWAGGPFYTAPRWPAGQRFLLAQSSYASTAVGRVA